MSKSATHSIYVIELDPAVLKERKFAVANPGCIDGKPCVYVGMTGLTPEKRFAQHMRDPKSCRYVEKYGLRLKPRQYRHHNPMTYEDAYEMEIEKARRLRNRGWAVWQN